MCNQLPRFLIDMKMLLLDKVYVVNVLGTFSTVVIFFCQARESINISFDHIKLYVIFLNTFMVRYLKLVVVVKLILAYIFSL